MLRGLVGDEEDRGLEPQERERGAREEGAVGAGDEEEVGPARGRRRSGLLLVVLLLLGSRLGRGGGEASALAVAPFRRRRGSGRDNFGRGSWGCHSRTSRSCCCCCSLPSFLGSEDEGTFFCFLQLRVLRRKNRKEEGG